MIRQFYLQKKLFLFGLIIAFFITFIDLVSKKMVFNFLSSLPQSQQHEQFAVNNFFNLVKVWNKGISFGMFNYLNDGKYIILSVNLVILSILLVWLYRNQVKYLNWAIALIIGGALGNIIDRIFNDAVADFLDFYILTYHWPAFNLADSSVFLGVCLLFLENFFVKKPEKPKNNSK